jgi:uncharacterized protein YdbL (DUF1318 family)
MKRRTKLMLAAAVGLAAVVGGTSYAYAMIMQADTSAQLRATGQVGEQSNGYLGIVGPAPADLRARVNAVNIRRRAAYTDLAGKRGVQIEEVGATMACEIFATSVLPGQYYRLPDGVWRQREGNAPIPRPSYCV